MIKRVLTIIAVISSIFIYAQGKEKTLSEKILGEKTLPSLTLNDVNGKRVTVSDYAKTGQITVVSFWATWCVPCKKELGNISELYEEWQQKYNMKLVAVSIDDSRSSSKVKPYTDSQRWEYDILLDPNQDLKRELNIQSIPFTILLNKKGKIVYTHTGYVDGDELVLEEEIKKFAQEE
ncbi:MAG: TlpA family protein disulfide reductase [Chitinophagales bacterium]|nr:TlpA family protein disulfide reductase [Chitinophagales bacterium]